MDNFITKSEAAKLLGVSRKTFSLWLKKDADLRKCLSEPMPRRRYISKPEFLQWKRTVLGYSNPFEEEV